MQQPLWRQYFGFGESGELCNSLYGEGILALSFERGELCNSPHEDGTLALSLKKRLHQPLMKQVLLRTQVILKS